METNVRSINGTTLRVATLGHGPDLLVLGGTGSTIEQLSFLLESLGQTFRVACHDQRGLGQSAIPRGTWTMADYAADALGVADDLSWDQFMLLGVSFGGMVALEVAAQAPDRVTRLCLWCTSPGGPSPSYPLDELAVLPEPRRTALRLTLTDRRFNPWWFLGHPFDRAIAQLMVSSEPLTPERQIGADKQLAARRTHDVTGRLTRFAAPTRVAAGRYDQIAPVGNGRAILDEITHADLQIYEGGHLFFVQDRRAVPESIRFLQNV